MKRSSWLFSLLLCAACSQAPSSGHPATPIPARVEKGEQGDVIVLTPSAVERLGIATTAVSDEALHRERTFPATVLVPPGRSAVLTAPLAAVVRGELPQAGAEVEFGATLMTLDPLLTADARVNVAAALVDAEGAARSSIAQLEAAELAFSRAERMLADGVGSERALEQARGARDSAAAIAEAATARRDQLAKAVDGAAVAIRVTAPFKGSVRQLTAAAGQVVAAGAVLGEIADLRELWLRVPVYVGEVDRLDTGAEVEFGGLRARPIAAPPSGDSVARTVDVFYAVADPARALRPGQTVFLPIPIDDPDGRLTVPNAALHRDVHGDASVYVALGDGRYERRSVKLLFVDGERASIVGGVTTGEQVVTAGVPELWGIESGHAR